MNANAKTIPVHAIKTKEMNFSGLGVINLAGNKGMAYDSSVPHRHAFFELLLFIQAGGNHEIDFGRYPVKNSNVHFICPGQIHKLNLKKNKGYVLCFTEEFVSLKSKVSLAESFPYFNNPHSPVLEIPQKLANELEELIRSIEKELSMGGIDNMDICRSYLNIILLKLKTFFNVVYESRKPGSQDKSQKVSQYTRLIEANYLSHKTVSDYARDLAVSPNHLNALCKKQLGKTATQLIQQRLLLESKRLLYATDMRVKEISYYLQFEDVPYFNRFFKKQMKITPNEYRSQFLQKTLKSASL